MKQTRRKFFHTSAVLGGAVLCGNFLAGCSGSARVRVNGHLWIYASQFPPEWDATPVLEQVFSDFQYAGIEGVELMEVNLRHDGAVSRMRELSEKYKIPVTGTSYNADMWDKNQREKILEDVELVVGRLSEVGGTNFGLTVGNAGRKKTDDE